jgi:hypothetical protein
MRRLRARMAQEPSRVLSRAGGVELPPCLRARSTQQAQKRRRVAVAIIASGVAPAAFRRRSGARKSQRGGGPSGLRQASIPTLTVAVKQAL